MCRPVLVNSAILFVLSLFAFAMPPQQTHTGKVSDSRLTYRSAGKAVNVDLFAPADGGTHPAVLVLHGAGGLTRIQNFYEIARYFAEHGYIALFPHYLDVTGQTSVDQRQIDHERLQQWKESIRDAIGFAISQPNVEKKRIAIVSFSLGSFLSLDMAADETRIGALAEFYGGISQFRSADVKRMPPLLILHGEKDDVVPVSRAYELEKLMQRLKSPYEIKIYPGEEHGFTPEHQRDALDKAIEFFNKHLESSPATSKPERVQ